MGKKRKSLPFQTRKQVNNSINKFVQSKMAGYEQEIRQKAIMSTLVNYGVVMCTVLHEQEGWGNKRLNRFLNQLMDLFEKVNNGEVSVDNLCDELFIKTGIDLK